MKSTDDIGYVVAKTRESLSTHLKTNEVNKVVVDTYQREIERYGARHIELSEQIFHAGSECVAAILKHLKEDSALRWKAAFLIVDALLTKLGLRLEQKKELVERMSDSFLREFNFNIHNSKSLNDAYRIKRKAVADLIGGLDKDDMDSFMGKHVNTYANDVTGIIGDIPTDKLNLSSYIHMEMNRLFANNNRLNEMMVYNYLTRYYKSEIAKAKSRNN